jgi:hypothetical protein
VQIQVIIFRHLISRRVHILLVAEVGRSATCSAMHISATCATRKFVADVRFNPQAADCGIAPAQSALRNIAADLTSTMRNIEDREKENILSFSVCQWTESYGGFIKGILRGVRCTK